MRRYIGHGIGLSTAVAAALMLTLPAQAGAPGQINPAKARVIEHWTPERRAAAIPRDLVLDERGLAYMRLPGGVLQPYGHQIAALAKGGITTNGKPVSGDSTPPVIDESSMDPASGDIIGASYTFSVDVTDSGSGVKSVTVSVRTQNGPLWNNFGATKIDSNTWQVSLQGFSNGNWEWQVQATDNGSKGGNTSNSSIIGFTVDTSGGTVPQPDPTPDPGGVVTNAQWSGGQVQTAAGRVYFEMPGNSRWKIWNGYVCSGTVVADGITGRSLILTAAHCVYDDANKAFARNVMFIPNQAATTGTKTDLNCNNDPLGCWVPDFGVVDVKWTQTTFPANIPVDYAFYVVPDAGAHQGNGGDANTVLDSTAGYLGISFAAPTTNLTTFAQAMGYSYSEDPKFMYCTEPLGTESSYSDLWLGQCGLSGGSSGGPWTQNPSAPGDGAVMSVNSWGYTNSPGMAGPRFHQTSTACVYALAQTGVSSATGDGYEGLTANCP